MADLISSFPVCSPCGPVCPVPTLHTCFLAYIRPESSPGGYTLPAEHVGKKYKVQTKTITQAGTQNCIRFPGTQSEYVSSNTSFSGSAVETRELDDADCVLGVVLSGYNQYVHELNSPDVYKRITVRHDYGAGLSYDGTTDLTTDEQGVKTETIWEEGVGTTVTKTLLNELTELGHWYALGDTWHNPPNVSNTTSYTNSPTEETEGDTSAGIPDGVSGTTTKTISTMWADLFYGRYRIEIPKSLSGEDWAGSWHRCQVDVNWVKYDSSSTGKSVEEIVWSGPGDQNDSASWFSAWKDVDIPAEHGTVTVVLNRSQCYHGAPWVDHTA